MEHHNIFYNIMTLYDKIEYKKENYYILKLKTYNYNYDNKKNIKIIGYKYETKKEQDILFNHVSNINILFEINNILIEIDLEVNNWSILIILEI